MSDNERTNRAGEKARQTTVLEGFATGGLTGLLKGLAAMGETPDGVDDPDALRRAEAEVASIRPPSSGSRRRIDGAWQVVATHDGPDGLVGLEDVARALESEGVTVGWDPYEPSQAVGFLPPGKSLRPYRIQVPVSELARARDVLYGVPPEGVTYDWDAAARPKAAGRTVDGPEFSERNEPTASHAPDGTPLSDNARLQHLAGPGLSGGALLALGVAVVGSLVAIGAAALVLLRR